jgi:DNA helicase HerA-like ATPase
LDTAETVDACVLCQPRSSRSFLVGTTGTGKSTLAEIMAKEYQKAYSQPKKPVRTIIADTKPRFRAEWELNGFPTRSSGRYSKWGYGAGILAGSYVIPCVGHAEREIEQVWRLGGNTVIVQTENESDWHYVSEAVASFYEDWGAEHARLVFVDELADFYKYRSLGDIFQRISRNGRERDVALISGSQRPRKVPVEVMTEMLRLYMFQLDFWEDIKHVSQFGIPSDIEKPEGHMFYMFDKRLRMHYPSNAYYELTLKKAA